MRFSRTRMDRRISSSSATCAPCDLPLKHETAPSPTDPFRTTCAICHDKFEQGIPDSIQAHVPK
eukprot:6184061-Pleurochrysis_carterae.AAC.2